MYPPSLYAKPLWLSAFLILLLGLGTPLSVKAQLKSLDSELTPPSAEPEIAKLPTLQKFVKAIYPEAAQKAGIEAKVILDLDIDSQGRVEQAVIVKNAETPGYGFNEAALAAVKQFIFTPALTASGEPLPVKITYEYIFKLASESPAKTPAKALVANFLGRLLERGSRNPLSRVLITIYQEDSSKVPGPKDKAGRGFEATTDEDGYFTFYNIPAGNWKIFISVDGYFPYKTTEELSETTQVNAKYYIEKGVYNPFDVFIEEEKPRKEVNRITLRREEIDKIPGTFGDPLQVVKNLPGVANNAANGEVVIRGASPLDSKFFVEGLEVPQIFHFGGALKSVLPMGMIEDVTFYPGNFSGYYGLASAGVIDTQLKKIKPRKLQGYTDVSLLDAGFYLETPLGEKGALAVAARRSYLDFILNAVIPSDASLNFQALRYYDYQLLTTYRPSNKHEYRLLILGSDDALSMLIRDPSLVSTQVRSNAINSFANFIRIIADYTYKPTARLQNVFKISYGKDIIDTSLGSQIKLYLGIKTPKLRNTTIYKASEHFILRLGLDHTLYITDYNVRSPLPPGEGDDKQNVEVDKASESKGKGLKVWTAGAFIETEIKPLKNISLIPGLRLDYLGMSSEVTLDPRFTGRWSLSKGLTIKGGAGYYHQPPNYDQTDKNFGNPDLKAEYALHYSLGTEIKPESNTLIDTTLFYKDLRHWIRRSNRNIPQDGHLVPLRYTNEGKGKVYGFDILLRQELSKRLFGWLAYTLSRSERLDEGSTRYRLFDYDQTHILTALASYVLPNNWQIGCRWRFVSGMPYTPYTGSIFNADTDAYMPISGPINSERMDSFHQLDLRLDKRWIYKYWMLSLYLDLQNVYNRPNPSSNGFSYNYDYSQKSTIQGLPLLPILGFKAEL